jgi:hypothetical protein
MFENISIAKAATPTKVWFDRLNPGRREGGDSSDQARPGQCLRENTISSSRRRMAATPFAQKARSVPPALSIPSGKQLIVRTSWTRKITERVRNTDAGGRDKWRPA